MTSLKQTPVVNTKNKLSYEAIREIESLIRQLLVDEQLFLRKGYTLSQLSKASGYTIHVLSAVINAAEKKHFNDYINYFRIHYCLDYIQKRDVLNLRLQELGAICGFNNRNTFTAAFKKITGKKPSQYFKYNS